MDALLPGRSSDTLCGMSETIDHAEVCAICGKDAHSEPSFCHFYQVDRRVTLCSPACAERYLHLPAVANGGYPAEGWEDAFRPATVM